MVIKKATFYIIFSVSKVISELNTVELQKKIWLECFGSRSVDINPECLPSIPGYLLSALSWVMKTLHLLLPRTHCDPQVKRFAQPDPPLPG